MYHAEAEIYPPVRMYSVWLKRKKIIYGLINYIQKNLTVKIVYTIH